MDLKTGEEYQIMRLAVKPIAGVSPNEWESKMFPDKSWCLPHGWRWF